MGTLTGAVLDEGRDHNKRPRAGTMSSVCSEELSRMLNSEGEGLGSILGSIELDRFGLRASASGKDRSALHKHPLPRLDAGGPSSMKSDRSDPSAASQQMSISSREMDKLLDSGLLSVQTQPGPSALVPLLDAASSPRTSPPFVPEESRTSSDLTRPLWRHVVECIDDVRSRLAVETDDISTKQQICREFYDTIVPRVKDLGPVGQVCLSRLNVMMAEAGLFVGSVQPESLPSLTKSVQEALASIKGYASSAMLASVVRPRSEERAAAVQSSLPEGNPFMGGGLQQAGALAVAPALPMPPVDGLITDGTLDVDGSDPLGLGPKLHACKNCQRAKTACNDTRPCTRCVRLQLSCDGDMRTVKRACASCKRSKVKCDLDDKQVRPHAFRTHVARPSTPRGRLERGRLEPMRATLREPRGL